MSEKPDMQAFERMVGRVLAYRPKSKRKKQKRKPAAKKAKSAKR
jgi:hypothetical protein